jgi:hypothetical protein
MNDVLSNFALVHGPWDDTWCWARAILELWRSGQDYAVAGLPRDRGAGTQKHEMALMRRLHRWRAPRWWRIRRLTSSPHLSLVGTRVANLFWSTP